jgi:hypothetical protein
LLYAAIIIVGTLLIPFFQKHLKMRIVGNIVLKKRKKLILNNIAMKCLLFNLLFCLPLLVSTQTKLQQYSKKEKSMFIHKTETENYFLEIKKPTGGKIPESW